jgi:predicted dehydrogenase
MTIAQPRQSNTLRVALIGAGMISEYHLNAWSRLAKRARIVAVADPDRARAVKRAETFGIPKIYTDVSSLLDGEKLDAVDIASPRETHVENVELAAAHGVDVLCQKPLAPTLAEAQALVNSVGKRVRLMVHENWRFRPWYRQIKAWSEEGLIGDPLLANMTFYSSGLLPDDRGLRPDLERQPFMAGETRFLIAEVLIHQIDVVRWLMGSLRVVGAQASRTLDVVKGETMGSILMETADGKPAVVTGMMAAPGFPPRNLDRFELIGTEGSAVLDQTSLSLLGPKRQDVTYDFAQSYQASFDGLIEHFADCLETGDEFETCASDNLETLRLVEHAYWAAGLRQ